MKALSSFTVSNLYEFLSSAEQDRTVDITSSTSKVGKKKNTLEESQWGTSTIWLLTFFKILSFVFSRREKFIQV